MTVSHRQKRWKRAHEQGWPHGCPHRRARSASLLTCSSTLETPPSAARYAHGLGTMSSASDALAKVAIVDLVDRNHWHCHAMRHALTMIPRWMPCMLLPARWVGPERAGVVQA